MVNVLINAYAVGPSLGSEPGMGWNWIVNIAKHCCVHVITEGEWREEILAAVAALPQRDNMHFYFLPVSDGVRRMCWNQGDYRFYIYYARWQRRALDLAREIVAKNHIDVMHQLNMIGFREPGYLYKIPDLPLVWGPIGGVANIPGPFLRGMGWKRNLFFRLKNVISDVQFVAHPRVRAMMRHAYPIAAVSAMQRKTLRHYGREIPLINETGTDVVDIAPRTFGTMGPLSLLWVGRFIPTKRLDIALKAVARCSADVRLTVCGTGSDEDVSRYRQLAADLGIADKVEWKGLVPHAEVQTLMQSADVFLFTSVVEATSTVVVEAISAGLPVLSHDACGFGSLVKGFAGRAVELVDPEHSATQFAAAIDYFSSHRDELARISSQEQENRATISWESKGEEIAKLYLRLTGRIVR